MQIVGDELDKFTPTPILHMTTVDRTCELTMIPPIFVFLA